MKRILICLLSLIIIVFSIETSYGDVVQQGTDSALKLLPVVGGQRMDSASVLTR